MSGTNSDSDSAGSNGSETSYSDDGHDGTSTSENTVTSLTDQQAQEQNGHQNREIASESTARVQETKKSEKRPSETLEAPNSKKKIKKSPKAQVPNQERNDDDTKNKKFDLTTVTGQMAANKGMSRVKAKNEAKREYNRRNAARARARNKNMVEDLQNKVAELTKRTEMWEKENSVLKAQLEVLTHQNTDLQSLQTSSSPSTSAVSQLHQKLPPAPAPAAAIDVGLAQQLVELLVRQQQAPTQTLQSGHQPAPAPKPAHAQNPPVGALDALSHLAYMMQQQQPQQQNQQRRQELNPSGQSAMNQRIMTASQPHQFQLLPLSLTQTVLQQQEPPKVDMTALLRTMSPQEIYSMLQERERR